MANQDIQRNPNGTDWLKGAKEGDGGKKSPFGAPKLSAQPTTVSSDAGAQPTGDPSAAAQATPAPATNTAQQQQQVLTPQNTQPPLPAPGAPVQSVAPVQSAPSVTNQQQPDQQLSRVIRVPDENTPIYLPGEPEPRTARQLAFERKQGKDLDQLQSRLNQKAQALEQKEQELARKEEEIKAANSAQAPQRPVQPQGYVPGDPEFAPYESDLRIYEHQVANQKTIAPLAQRIESQEVGRVRQEVAQATYEFNDTAIANMFDSLPFNFHRLSPVDQATVRDSILDAARARGVSFDRQSLSSSRLHPDTIELIKRDALDDLVIPQQAPQQQPQATTYQDPTLAALPQLQQPLVPKAPDPPPLQPGTGGMSAPLTSAPKAKSFGRSEKDRSWVDRV